MDPSPLLPALARLSLGPCTLCVGVNWAVLVQLPSPNQSLSQAAEGCLLHWLQDVGGTAALIRRLLIARISGIPGGWG